jgi:cardiolipin synthase
MYNHEMAVKVRKTFEEDVKVSSELTEEIYSQRTTWIKFKEGFARLISPIL